MTKFTLVGQLPRHLYVWVNTEHTHVEPIGYVPAVWFGLVSYPGRAWGCTVMLESGAVYRNLPPHALWFRPVPADETPMWDIDDAQTWDCYGEDFTAIEYDYLSALPCMVRTRNGEVAGRYLFTVAPVGDAFSAYPEQAKEFYFIETVAGALTIQPTNRAVFVDKSFTTNRHAGEARLPTGLQRQTDVWRVE
jgi:hypothetical protein